MFSPLDGPIVVSFAAKLTYVKHRLIEKQHIGSRKCGKKILHRRTQQYFSDFIDLKLFTRHGGFPFYD